MAAARSKENMKQTVGVVGLGAMGQAIATNLLKAGFHTTVWNRSPEPVSELASAGAVGAKNIGEVLVCDVVLSVLFNDAASVKCF
jgi:3-hydroxyisobutyrate dehydrogenase-like beta-hydroxyacid dehydrogenase